MMGRPPKRPRAVILSPSPVKRTGFSNLMKIPGIKLLPKDIKDWFSQIEQRGTKNQLYRIADRFQGSMVIQGLITIQRISEHMNQFDGDVTELNKLTTSLNRAISSINQALNHLGVTGLRREDEADTDPLSAFLQRACIESEIPPILNDEYIAAKNDIARAGGKSGPTSSGSDTEPSVLAELKKPLKSFTEENDPKTEIVDVEVDGIEAL